MGLADAGVEREVPFLHPRRQIRQKPSLENRPRVLQPLVIGQWHLELRAGGGLNRTVLQAGNRDGHQTVHRIAERLPQPQGPMVAAAWHRHKGHQPRPKHHAYFGHGPQCTG